MKIDRILLALTFTQLSQSDFASASGTALVLLSINDTSPSCCPAGDDECGVKLHRERIEPWLTARNRIISMPRSRSTRAARTYASAPHFTLPNSPSGSEREKLDRSQRRSCLIVSFDDEASLHVHLPLTVERRTTDRHPECRYVPPGQFAHQHSESERHQPQPQEILLRCITILIQLLHYEFSMTKLDQAQDFLPPIITITHRNYHDHA